MKNPNKTIRIIAYIICALFWLFIAWNIPYQADDWNWGTSDGIKQFLGGTINHRYFGNLLVVILTRNKYIKTIIIGLDIWLLIYLMTYFVILISEKKQFEGLVYAVSMLTILILNKSVWAQTFGWVSGFCNYIVSTIFMVLYLIIYYRLYTDSISLNLVKILLIFLFSICSMLCLENLSMAIMLSTLLMFLRCLKNKKESKNNYSLKTCVIVLIGNAIGFVIMFINHFFKDLFVLGYQSDFEGDKGHQGREIIYDLDKGFIVNFKIFIERFKFIVSKTLKNELSILIVFVLLIVVFLIVCKQKGKKQLSFIIWMNIFSVILMIPFFVVLTSGDRVFVHQYILLSVVSLYFIVESLDSIKSKINMKLILVPVILSDMMFSVFNAIDYYNIGLINREREESIRINLENGNEEIGVIMYDGDYLDYLWRPYDISDDYLTYYFREFYSIPDNVKIDYYFNR